MRAVLITALHCPTPCAGSALTVKHEECLLLPKTKCLQQQNITKKSKVWKI